MYGLTIAQIYSNGGRCKSGEVGCLWVYPWYTSRHRIKKIVTETSVPEVQGNASPISATGGLRASAQAVQLKPCQLGNSPVVSCSSCIILISTPALPLGSCSCCWPWNWAVSTLEAWPPKVKLLAQLFQYKIYNAASEKS